MITVFLRGGLGNQMFQYALGLNLAKKNNADLLLDTTFLNDRFPRKEFTYRTFDLDVFDTAPHFTALSKVSEKFPVPGLWLGLDLALIKAEKFFVDIADDVRRVFRFKRELSGLPSRISSDEIREGEAAALAEKIENSNSVSLHVRRGDYVNFENMKRIVGDTGLSYYARAVSYIVERITAPHFFIFSDDIAWCRENIKIPFPAEYLDDTTAGPKNAFHLLLMSLCKHNIITNSTFSWWGAWLNQNPGKIVVAPNKWFSGVDSKTSDIVPEGWIKM